MSYPNIYPQVLAQVEDSLGNIGEYVLVWAWHETCDKEGWVYADSLNSCLDDRDIKSMIPFHPSRGRTA